jgi:uncharacterized protein YhfF
VKPFELGRPGTALRTRLVDAVLRGEKTATAGLGAAPPAVGERFTLDDFHDVPVGVVEVTEARVVGVADVDLAFVRDEGEGFETVADWRRAHEEFFGRPLRDDELVEAVRFRLTDLVVAQRYRGPDVSGNGGYTCGLVATALVGGDAEVTLRVPPPLDTPLRIDGLSIHDGEVLVAEAAPATVELDLPEPVPYEEAVALQAPFDPAHPFRHCFVCGPEGEGFRVRPGAAGRGRVVAPLQLDESRRELVWAALDCPGAFAVNPDFERGVTVLGRLAAHIEELPAPGEELVVVGWPLGEPQGRRFFAGTALFRGKTPLAWAQATWIAVPDAVPSAR